MPKLKKRWNVPNQKRPKKKAKLLCVNSDICLDHAYAMHQVIATESLNEEVEMLNNSIHIDELLPDIVFFESEEIVITEPDPYELLKSNIQEQLPQPYKFNKGSENIQIFQLYPACDKLSVKLNITIDRDFNAKVFVHRIQLPMDHSLWFGLPTVYESIKSIQTLLLKIERFTVCVGNHDIDIIDIIPVGSAVQQANSSSPHSHVYREGDFGAVKGTISYSSTIRSVNCSLLVEGNRCYCCSKLRKYLVDRKYRREERKQKKDDDSSTPNFMHTRIKHKDMSREQLITKINQQKDKINCLQSEISKTKRTFQHDLAANGVTLDTVQ